MQVQLDNPYVSPRAFEEALAEPLSRKTDWARGLAMGLLWEGIGSAAILGSATAARILFSAGEPLRARLNSTAHELPQFIGPAIFFGAFFSLAATATYAPGAPSSFAKTLSLIFTSFVIWILSLAIVTYPFQWPLMAFPSAAHRYQPSLAMQLWVGFWFLLGSGLFTGYLTWRRIRKSPL